MQGSYETCFNPNMILISIGFYNIRPSQGTTARANVPNIVQEIRNDFSVFFKSFFIKQYICQDIFPK